MQLSLFKNSILILLVVMTPAALADLYSKKTGIEFSFGIVPQQSAMTLAKNWVPILKYISEQTGVTIRFRTATNIPTFESRLASGEYDFAYMNPYHYVTYNKYPGYQAFANQSDKKIKGILVKSRQSRDSSLQDLEGKTLAFPSPAAFAASLLPRAELAKMSVDFTPKYVGSHDSVYRAVARGLYPAGGGIERTFNTLDPEVKSQLDIFWTSSGYTPHAFAAHPRVAPEIVNRIKQLMLKMHHKPDAKELLSRIKFKGIQAATDSDWNDIRTLDLQPIKSGLNR